MTVWVFIFRSTFISGQIRVVKQMRSFGSATTFVGQGTSCFSRWYLSRGHGARLLVRTYASSDSRNNYRGLSGDFSRRLDCTGCFVLYGKHFYPWASRREAVPIPMVLGTER